jgi:hypothetical protein
VKGGYGLQAGGDFLEAGLVEHAEQAVGAADVAGADEVAAPAAGVAVGVHGTGVAGVGIFAGGMREGGEVGAVVEDVAGEAEGVVGGVFADEAFAGVEVAGGGDGEFAIAKAAADARGVEAGELDGFFIEPVEGVMGEAFLPEVGGAGDGAAEAECVVAGPAGPEVEGGLDAADAEAAEVADARGEVIDGVGADDHHDGEGFLESGEAEDGAFDGGGGAAVFGVEAEAVVDGGESVAGDGGAEVGLGEEVPGVVGVEGAVGGELEGDGGAGVPGEIAGEVDPVADGGGLEEGLAAEEAEVELAGGREGSEGAADGGVADGGGHAAGRFLAGVAVSAAHVAGVGDHEGEGEGWIGHGAPVEVREGKGAQWMYAGGRRRVRGELANDVGARREDKVGWGSAGKPLKGGKGYLVEDRADTHRSFRKLLHALSHRVKAVSGDAPADRQ